MPTPKSFLWATALAKKETTFGGGFASDPVYADWLVGQEADFVSQDRTYADNSNEINGAVGAPTEHTLELVQGSLARKFNASTELLTSFHAWALSNVTTSGSADPWTHTIKWRDPCTLNPASLSFIELLNCAGATGTFWKYKGGTVESISVEVNGRGYIQLTVNIKTDGSETAAASFTVPTAQATVRRLLGNQVTLKYGPLGTETLTGLRSVKWTLNNGLVVPDNISTSTLVSEFQYGENNPSIEISFTIKGDKSHAIYGYAQAKTACILNCLIDPGVSPSRTFQLLASQTICSANVTPQGNETRLDVTVMAESNATDGSAANPKPAQFIGKTGASALLVAA